MSSDILCHYSLLLEWHAEICCLMGNFVVVVVVRVILQRNSSEVSSQQSRDWRLCTLLDDPFVKTFSTTWLNVENSRWCLDFSAEKKSKTKKLLVNSNLLKVKIVAKKQTATFDKSFWWNLFSEAKKAQTYFAFVSAKLLWILWEKRRKVMITKSSAALLKFYKKHRQKRDDMNNLQRFVRIASREPWKLKKLVGALNWKNKTIFGWIK